MTTPKSKDREWHSCTSHQPAAYAATITPTSLIGHGVPDKQGVIRDRGGGSLMRGQSKSSATEAGQGPDGRHPTAQGSPAATGSAARPGATTLREAVSDRQKRREPPGLLYRQKRTARGSRAARSISGAQRTADCMNPQDAADGYFGSQYRSAHPTGRGSPGSSLRRSVPGR